MPKMLLLVTALMLSSSAAVAEQSRPLRLDKGTAAAKPQPLKRPSAVNSCAQYGAGFVMVEGTGTCVKTGGAVSVGVGGSVR
jgi:Porin subfamily